MANTDAALKNDEATLAVAARDADGQVIYLASRMENAASAGSWSKVGIQMPNL